MTNVSYKNKFILIHNQAKAIATGTIIEFTDRSSLHQMREMEDVMVFPTNIFPINIT